MYLCDFQDIIVYIVFTLFTWNAYAKADVLYNVAFWMQCNKKHKRS